MLHKDMHVDFDFENTGEGTPYWSEFNWSRMFPSLVEKIEEKKLYFMSCIIFLNNLKIQGVQKSMCA
jgi:hypothetical protein